MQVLLPKFAPAKFPPDTEVPSFTGATGLFAMLPDFFGLLKFDDFYKISSPALLIVEPGPLKLFALLFVPALSILSLDSLISESLPVLFLLKVGKDRAPPLGFPGVAFAPLGLFATPPCKPLRIIYCY